MASEAHRVHRLSVDFSMSGLGDALKWRARIEDLARMSIPRVLERIFDAVALPDLHIRLDRLDLDLGVIAADRLDQEAPAALERALTEALTAAIAAARHAPSPAMRTMTPREAQLDRFAAYLATGSVPFRNPGEAFDPAEDLRQLIAEQSTELVARLRRRARDRYVLERLVLQVGEGGLRALLALLAPDDAAVILAYLADLLRMHATEPILPIAAPVLRQRLWLLTLDYLLRDAGTHFNRLVFLRFLLERAAEAEGVSYPTLLLLLRDALVRTRQQTPLGGSLPAMVDELLALSPPDADHQPDPARTDDPFIAAEAGDITSLLALFRRTADNRAVLETLVRRLTPRLFAALIRRLEPANAVLVLAYVSDLNVVHREQALLTVSAMAFEQLVQVLVLQNLLRNPGSQFNRRSWLRWLLQNLAVSEDLIYAQLLASLVGAMARLRNHLPATSSLPALVVELAEELAPGDREATDGSESAGGPDGLALAARDPTAWLRTLEQADKAKRAILIRWIVRDPDLLMRMMATMDDDARRKWIVALDPVHADTVLADLRVLWRLHAIERVLPLDSPAFGRLTWAMALRAIERATSGGGGFDRTELLRRLLAGLARHQATSASELAADLLRALDRAAIPYDETAALEAILWETQVPRPDARVMAERFLRTGQPSTAGEGLRDWAEQDPKGLAALLRRLTTAASGQTAALMDRLLTWLLPEEIVETLLPGQSEQAVLLADILADGTAGTMAAAWGQVLDRALRGEAITVPDTLLPPGARLDRLALLRHWMDFGTMAWWAAPEPTIDALLAELPDQKQSALQALFADADLEQATTRLRRTLDRLGPTPGLSLLKRLAPWVFAPSGPVALMQSGRNPHEQDNIRLRATAAALTGAPFDLSDLAAPIPAPLGAPVDIPAPSEPSDRETLLAWLSGVGPDAPRAIGRLIRLLADLADAGDSTLDAALRAGIVQPELRARWIAVLPDEVLGRVLYRIAPARARFMLDAMAILAVAWRQTAAPGERDSHVGLPWPLLLAALSEPRELTSREVVDRLVTELAAFNPTAAGRLLARANVLAREGGHANILAVLRSRANAAAAPRKSLARRKAEQAPDAVEPGETMYIHNAGLVLFNPFLPLFFERLGLLTVGEDGIPRLAGVEAATRGVHLLQYLADGRCDRPEPDLMLNKLLCGVGPATPVARSINPSEPDLEICADMIQAVIGNWPIIRNTSPDGLRETFLQRDGRLRRGDDRWTLHVQRKTVDVLTDQISWNRSVVYYRWMSDPIHVTW
ncbi:MAG TPA: contractile injection system tape measure protein [Rhodopila sp.]|nr:contractile injection system tape measure protein [Rhodopila sp.]